MSGREGFERLSLRGLSREEVAGYIERRAASLPTPDLVGRVFDETEGNPFFLSEVVNVMAEDTLDAASPTDIPIPEGVTQALGRRLDRLSNEANELLVVAAVAGREFDCDTLRLQGDQDEDTLLGLIEEGLRAQVVEEIARRGRYRFTHALMQETLLSELSTNGECLQTLANIRLPTRGAVFGYAMVGS